MRGRRVTPKFWLLVILATLGVFLMGFLVTNATFSRDADTLEKRTDELIAAHTRVKQLRDDIDFSQTETYIERVARSELGLIMPGEVRYVNGG